MPTSSAASACGISRRARLILECAGGKFWCEATAGTHKFRMIASNGLVHKKFAATKMI